MPTERPSIVITGLGAVTPLGVGCPAFVRGLRDASPGVRALDPSMPGFGRIRSRVAATCPDFDPRTVMSEADLRRLPRLVPMALAAAREAVAQSGLDRALGAGDGAGEPGPLSRGVGLVLGTGAGGIDFTLDQAMIAYGPEAESAGRERARNFSLWTITNATHGNLAGELSIRLGLRGPSWCMSTGCASSSDAIGAAMEQLRSTRPGAPEAMVVVGADAHVRWETLLGMELLGVISLSDGSAVRGGAGVVSRPFDEARDGFVLGEGAWAMVLEREGVARAREARPIARALGYGATCDAFHRVRPAPDMEESARAMRQAIDDAGLTPTDIDVVHYHGTSTALNDAAETKAVKLAFGEATARRLIGHSIKGQIGHPQGASGIAAAVASLGAMTGQDDGPAFLPPTAHLDNPDAAGGCDLDYTPLRARPLGAARTLLVNCLAFGAKNSALVFDVGAP